jgi:hypothetical protein
MKKNKILKILNIIFFILILTITFYIIFKKNSLTIIIKNITKMNPIYLILAIISMLIYIACEGINIKRILKTLGQKVTFINSFKYGAVGFFFSAITPSSTGGDPAQLYFMVNDKIKVSHAALSLLVELCSFQLVACLLGTIGFITNFDIISKLGHLKYLTYIGLGINILIIIFLLIMIFSKKVAIKLLNITCKILKFFSYKKINTFKEKATKQIEEYHNCSIYLINNKKTLIKVILTTLIELILYNSIPYLIGLSFGIENLDPFKLITLSAVLYTTVAFIPSPGSMGISEGTFIIMYKLFFPAKLLSTAMIISRVVNYYLFVITCGILILIFIIAKKLKQTKTRKTTN